MDRAEQLRAEQSREGFSFKTRTEERGIHLVPLGRSLDQGFRVSSAISVSTSGNESHSEEESLQSPCV